MRDQKGFEFEVARATASLLGEDWQIVSRESPDFSVTADGMTFGLEVTQLFAGPTDKDGSSARRAESANAAWLHAIQAEFEQASPAKLYLSFRGEASDDARTEILEILAAQDLANKGPDFWFKRPLRGGFLHVRTGLVTPWRFMNDAEGWASFDDGPLRAAIEKKSAKLERYSRDHEDVRLIAFTESSLNSGKLVITHFDGISLGGFSKIYLLRYPFELVVLDHEGSRTFPPG